MKEREFEYEAQLNYPYRIVPGAIAQWQVDLYTAEGEFVMGNRVDTRWGALRWAKKQAKHHAQGGDARIAQKETVRFSVKVAA